MEKKSLLKDPFISMVVYGFLGAVAGMLSGFVLMFLLLALVSFTVIDSVILEQMREGFIPIFSMGAGAVIGGLLGGVVGIKKAK